VVETLDRQIPNADIYKRQDGLMHSIVGVNNGEPFESEGGYRTQIINKADKIAPGIWRYRNAKMGFTVDMNTRRVRCHPVRGSWSKYYEMEIQGDEPFRFNSIHFQLVELYIDGENEKESVYLTPRGFKLHTVAKNANARSEYKYNVSLNGLRRSGRVLVDPDTGKTVARFPKPTLWDSSPIPIDRPVSESLNAGELTLTADLTGLTFPVTIDPSVSDIAPDIDSSILKNATTSNVGADSSAQALRKASLSSVVQRVVTQWDLSALGINTVTSGSFFVYCDSTFGSWTNISLRIILLIESILAEGTGTWGAQTTDGVSWNYRDAAMSIPWTTPGGTLDLGFLQTILKSNTDTGVFWEYPNIQSIIQEAVDNYSSLLGLMNDFAANPFQNYQAYFRSKDDIDSSKWPHLDIVYDPVSAVAIPPHIFQRVR
jgi:hypothetical protein